MTPRQIEYKGVEERLRKRQTRNGQPFYAGFSWMLNGDTVVLDGVGVGLITLKNFIEAKSSIDI